MGAVEKRYQDTRKSLIEDENDADDDAAVVDVCHATGARSFQVGSTPLELATIKYFLRFHIATSRKRIDDKRITINSLNTL